MEFAGAALPADRPGRVVVSSDGRWTGADPQEAASVLAERGVEIDVLPAPADERPEIGAARIEKLYFAQTIGNLSIEKLLTDLLKT